MNARIRNSTILRIMSFFVAVVLLLQTEIATAGQFRNLDFELAVIDEETGGFGFPLASQALPYWTTFLPHDYIPYNMIALDASFVSIYDELIGYYNPLEGTYSVMLGDGFGDDGSGGVTAVDAWISQTGNVPLDAKSLMFRTDTGVYRDRFLVSLDATPIPMSLYSVDIDNQGAYGPVETYIGDISAFSGQNNVELRFTKVVQDPSNPFHHGLFTVDAIEFSPITVPEPSTVTLLCIATISLLAYVRRRRLRRISP